jgi:hypothetical protein
MSAAETFRAWITKYALTAGIKEIEAEDCFDISATMIKDANAEWLACYHGDDWHRTRESAVVKAEKMRLKKIASLKQQIAKLEGIKFS